MQVGEDRALNLFHELEETFLYSGEFEVRMRVPSWDCNSVHARVAECPLVAGSWRVSSSKRDEAGLKPIADTRHVLDATAENTSASQSRNTGCRAEEARRGDITRVEAIVRPPQRKRSEASSERMGRKMGVASSVIAPSI